MVKKLTIVFFILFIVFVGLEISSAVLNYINQKKVRETYKLYKLLYMKSPDKETSYEHRPNVDLDFKSVKADCTMHIKTNSLGLREDRDIPFKKPEGVIRIIGLGDSVMFGASVDNDETMLKWIERFGNEKGLKIETLNYGVGSSNPYHEYHYFLYKRGLDYHPDILILGFVFNDFDNRCREFDETAGNWRPCGEKAGQDVRIAARKDLKAFLKQFASVRLLDTIKDAIKDKCHIGYCAGYPYTQQTVDGLKNNARTWISKIQNTAKNNNIKLVAVIVPAEDQVKCLLQGSKVSLAWREAAIEMCGELGIDYYDPASEMVEMIREDKYNMQEAFWDGTHPYKIGHRILGELILNFLIEKGYVNKRAEKE